MYLYIFIWLHLFTIYLKAHIPHFSIWVWLGTMEKLSTRGTLLWSWMRESMKRYFAILLWVKPQRCMLFLRSGFIFPSFWSIPDHLKPQIRTVTFHARRQQMYLTPKCLHFLVPRRRLPGNPVQWLDDTHSPWALRICGGHLPCRHPLRGPEILPRGAPFESHVCHGRFKS